MVTRVAIVILCAVLLCATAPTTEAIAGGPCYQPPPCVPQPCAPAYFGPPSPCGPPMPCGPQRSPLSICAGLLGGCASICGTIIKIPAAIMGGILAPPFLGGKRGYGKLCAPQPACPPLYVPAPCPAPQRIRKCETNYSCQFTTPAPCGPNYCPPSQRAYGPPGFPPPPPGFPPLLPGIPGPGATRIVDAPIKLVAGVLTAPLTSRYASVADKDGAANKSTFDCYW